VTGYDIRAARAADYDAIAAVVDDWWGRPVLRSLPRLYLHHFHTTSFVAEGANGSAGSNGLAGFLVGFMSPSQPHEAYIAFIGVAPQTRGSGLARTLYERFFRLAREHGRTVVTAHTPAINEGSIAFHRRMGFSVDGPVPDYNGPGRDLVVFRRGL